MQTVCTVGPNLTSVRPRSQPQFLLGGKGGQIKNWGGQLLALLRMS